MPGPPWTRRRARCCPTFPRSLRCSYSVCPWPVLPTRRPASQAARPGAAVRQWQATGTAVPRWPAAQRRSGAYSRYEDLTSSGTGPWSAGQAAAVGPAPANGAFRRSPLSGRRWTRPACRVEAGAPEHWILVQRSPSPQGSSYRLEFDADGWHPRGRSSLQLGSSPKARYMRAGQARRIPARPLKTHFRLFGAPLLAIGKLPTLKSSFLLFTFATCSSTSQHFPSRQCLPYASHLRALALRLSRSTCVSLPRDRSFAHPPVPVPVPVPRLFWLSFFSLFSADYSVRALVTHHPSSNSGNWAFGSLSSSRYRRMSPLRAQSMSAALRAALPVSWTPGPRQPRKRPRSPPFRCPACAHGYYSLVKAILPPPIGPTWGSISYPRPPEAILWSPTASASSATECADNSPGHPVRREGCGLGGPGPL